LLHPLNWYAGVGDWPASVLGVGLLLFSMAYISLLVRFWRGSRSFQDLVNGGFTALILAFLLGAARSQPWHLLWPATLAGLSSSRKMQAVIVGLSGLMLAVQVSVEWAVPSLCFLVN
jgi:Na+/phosphate symporter